MHQPYDRTLKYLLETYPQDLLGHLLGLPITGPVTHLQTELPVDVHIADALMEVQLANEPPVLVHLEVQTRYEPDMPLRMLDYAVRIHYKRRRPVRSWLLVLLPPGPEQAQVQDSCGWGSLQQGWGLTFHYHVIRIWELAADLGFQHPGLLPLVPLMHKADPSPAILDQCSSIVDTWNPPQPERQNLLWCLGNLASLRYNEDTIRDWMRKMGMIDTPLMRSLREEGKAEGKAEGEAQTLLIIIATRGLLLSEAQRETILNCRNLTQLEDWIKRSLTVQSIEELLA